MITFDNVDRNYEIASKTFSLNIPEIFNFGFDVLDVRAQEANKDALLAIDAVTGKAKEAVGVKTLEMLGLEEPQAGEEHGRYDPFSRFTTTDSGIDFTNSYTVNAFAQQGNNTVPYGLANRNYVSNFFDPNSNASANDFMTQYYVGANVNRQLGVTP